MTTHIITTADDPVDFDGSTTWKGNSIAAGDTVEIQSGTYSSVFKFTNVAGSSGSEISVVNTGGQVSLTKQGAWAFILENCQHINFQFDNVGGTTYGLRTTNRIKIHDECNNLTFRWIEVDGSPGIGLHIDQNDVPLTEITDITMEDCYVHDCAGEPIYAGSNRNGKAANEHILRRIYMRRIRTEDCAEGPNINSCLGGWEISNCTAIGHRPDGDTAHNAGISIGKGASAGECFNNTITDCNGMGIAINNDEGIESSSDVVNIYGNVIHNVGWWTGTNPRTDGIKVSDSGPRINIYNNTITQVGNGTDGYGIRITQTNNYAYDNIVLDCEVDGVSRAAAVPEANAYYNLSQDGSDNPSDNPAVFLDDYTTTTIKFEDYANDDFRPQSDSPAIGVSSTGGDVGALSLEDAISESDTITITDSASVVAVPPGEQTDLEIQVGAGSNDGRQLDSGSVNLSQTGSTIDDIDDYFAFRFTSVSIPPNATINSCIASLSVVNTSNDSPDSELFFEDVDDSAALSETNGDFSNRTGTTAKITWQDTDIGTGFKESPDLKTSLQEVVDRPGWLSGNDLTLLVKHLSDTNSLRVDMYEGGAADAAKININYTAPQDDADVSVSETITASESASLIVSDPVPEVSDTVTVIETVSLVVIGLVSESETVAVSESVSLDITRAADVSDTVAVSEAINVQIEQTGVAMVNVSETVALSEAVTQETPDLGISVSETITLSDTPDVTQPVALAASDTVTLTESVSAVVIIEIVISETVTLTETVDPDLIIDVPVSETVTLSEVSGAGLGDEGSVQVSDTVAVTESVTVRPLVEVQTDDNSVNVFEAVGVSYNPDLSTSETVAIGEAINVQIEVVNTFSVNVNEIVSLSEQSGAAQGEALAVDVSDSVTLTENADTSLGYAVDVSDTVTITENVSLSILVEVNGVTESVTLSELVSSEIVSLVAVSETLDFDESRAFDVPVQASASETVTLTESAAGEIGVYEFSVNETLTISENVQSDVSVEAAVQDTLAATENVLASAESGVAVSDTVTVSESVAYFIPAYTIMVSELVGVDESFVLYDGGLISVTVTESS